MPNSGLLTITGLAVVLFILFLLWLILRGRGNKTMGIVLAVSVVIFLVVCGVVLFRAYSGKEGFYFRVSPQRTKCLLEQVLPVPRTPECCGKGTVGGYPPKYQEWLGPPAMKRTEAAPADVSVPDYVPHETCPSNEGFEYETAGEEGKTGFVYYFHDSEASTPAPEKDPENGEGFTLHGRSRRDILEAVRRGV